MIYFITNNTEYYRKTIDTRIFKDITIVDENTGYNLFFKFFSKHKLLAVDLEATGLDAYTSTPLLYGIGTTATQFMFDWTINITPIFEHLVKYKVIVLGHNIQYDMRLVKVNTGVQITRVYDTMIAEQRLWMKSGYRWGYADLIERYLKKHIFKGTRNEFIGVNIDTFKISPSHLQYLKGDLVDLFAIRKIQQQKIKNFKMEFLIYGIEFPLISIIAKAELEGFVFDKEKWLKRLEGEKKLKFQTELELDAEVIRLREYVSDNGGEDNLSISPRISLGGIRYNNPRKHNPEYDIFKADGTTTNLNIFGEPMSHSDVTRVKKKVVFNPNNISWNSKKEIIHVFAALGESLPTTKDTYQVPQLDGHGKIVGSLNQFTIEEDALLKYQLQKPNSIMLTFINLKIQHSKLEKSIGTYGENFINKINKVSGRIHTSFRQCFANTGRFQSGGGRKEPDKYNAQNIPAKLEYRECFTVNTETHSVSTADYGGAELIVMASHAQDFRLIELSKQDMHSYMATKCWKNIFAYRAQQLLNLFKKSVAYKTVELVAEYTKNVNLYRTFEVTKANKEKRTEFKPMTFGTIYGMYAKKAGASLNVIPEEGKVVIKTIEGELPKTFAMVKQASLDAENQGYVILNDRTNSRVWFPILIKQLRGEISKDTHFIEISSELSAARNVRIQGTQADFVKEASVVLDRWFIKHKIDALILSWVHDELVVKVPKELDGVSDKWKHKIENEPDFLLPPSITGKRFNNVEEVIQDIMIEVANRYLKNVTIGVDISTHDNWIK